MTDLYARGHALNIVRSVLVGDTRKRLRCKDCSELGTIGNFLAWPNCIGPPVVLEEPPPVIAGQMGTAPEAEASGAAVVANACTAGIENGTPEE